MIKEIEAAKEENAKLREALSDFTDNKCFTKKGQSCDHSYIDQCFWSLDDLNDIADKKLKEIDGE